MNSFFHGMRSAALGGQNVRSPDQRSADQDSTVSGNPRTVFNQRAIRPMMGAATQPMPTNAMGAVAPQWAQSGQPGMLPQQQQMAVQQMQNAQQPAPAGAPVTMPVRPMFGQNRQGGNGFQNNLNRGRLNYARPMFQ